MKDKGVVRQKLACVAFSAGCLRSQMNAALLMEYFKCNGWEITTNLSRADIVLIGTCGFQQLCEDISFRYIAIANRKKKPEAPLVVFGCLPAINAQRLTESFPCLPLTGKELVKLDDVIGATVKLKEVSPPHDLKDYEKKYRRCFTRLDTLRANFEVSRRYAGECASAFGLSYGNKRILDEYEKIYNVKVVGGCRERCSYCAIRFAEGELVSQPRETILSEFDAGLRAGYTAFNLIGTDVGAWGQDRGTNVAELLGAMVGRPAPVKIVFSDFHPRWLVQHFRELFPLFTGHAEKFGFLGFPIQSGSDRVLELMARAYRIHDVEQSLIALRQAAPALRLITHILVGFPGETPEDFAKTIAFMRKIKFHRVSLYMYSDRPGTTASQLPDKLPPKIIKQRFQQFRREFRAIIG